MFILEISSMLASSNAFLAINLLVHTQCHVLDITLFTIFESKCIQIYNSLISLSIAPGADFSQYNEMIHNT